MSRYRFVEDHQAAYPVSRLCRLVGVSRSGFYAWRGRRVSARDAANGRLLTQIREIHEASLGCYGRLRVTGQLRRRGRAVNHKRVGRLMRHAGLYGVGGPGYRKRPHTAAASAGVFGPDLICRQFSAVAPDRRWVADITEFSTQEGRLYLAAVMDLYSRRIVGWSINNRRTAELVVDALVMAIAQRRPDGRVIHHADHGSQYTSTAFCDRAFDEGVRLSFGRVGTAADNAAMEAFWSTLKRELAHIHGHRTWQTRRQLRAALFEYIEVFYNRQRHQPRLGHKTPAEYEADLTEAA